MSDETWAHMDTFWELIDEIFNVILFMLIGLELLVMPIRREWLLAGGIAIAIVLLARLVSVAGIIGALRTVTSQSRGTSVCSRGGVCAAGSRSRWRSRSRRTTRAASC